MKRKTLLILSILFGLVFINAGLNKFFNYMPAPDDLPEKVAQAMTALSEISWLLPLIAVAEIVGGLLFMINRFRAFGAIIIAPILTGIILHHLVIAPSGLPMALILLAIYVWVIVENREKYLPLVKNSKNHN